MATLSRSNQRTNEASEIRAAAAGVEATDLSQEKDETTPISIQAAQSLSYLSSCFASVILGTCRANANSRHATTSAGGGRLSCQLPAECSAACLHQLEWHVDCAHFVLVCIDGALRAEKTSAVFVRGMSGRSEKNSKTRHTERASHEHTNANPAISSSLNVYLQVRPSFQTRHKEAVGHPKPIRNQVQTQAVQAGHRRVALQGQDHRGHPQRVRVEAPLSLYLPGRLLSGPRPRSSHERQAAQGFGCGEYWRS